MQSPSQNPDASRDPEQRFSMRQADILGRKYARLTVIAHAPMIRGRAAVVCRCECGNKVTIQARGVIHGNTRSCGCYALEISAKNGRAGVTHGMSKTPTYRSWSAMIRRCESKNHPDFKHWGARGIKICQRWRESFEAFYADMGERPDGMTLDRINVDGDYEPSNCRWATPVEQGYNQRGNKLNPDLVREIRKRYASGESGRSIAADVGMTKDALVRAARGRTWREVP